jgi:predicted  nucleic acid-binding Zn-ribbon protein
MSDTKTVEEIEKKHAIVQKEVAELKELVAKLSGGDAQLLQQLKDLKETLLAEKHEIELSLAEKATVWRHYQHF